VIIQVFTRCDAAHGTFQHALMLCRAFDRLGMHVRLVSVGAAVCAAAEDDARHHGLEIAEVVPCDVSKSDLNVVVGLWEQTLAETATRLMRDRARIILAPTVYWNENMLPDFRGRAEALWYVSWDQASWARKYWHLAETVEVVHCAVDPVRFRPSPARASGHPWILCRHSRDSAEKFADDVLLPLKRLRESHDLVFRMLGAATNVDPAGYRRVEVFQEGSTDPAVFLRDGDVWLYAHAAYWRETACIAMLEAMASGLPVVVNAIGGMREYFVHGRTGFGCNDVNEFCDFTQLLLEVPALRSAMADESRQHVARHFSLESLTEKVRSILRL
jgi:glycosyltransferase involved in cell wall biosynthesis